MNLKHAKQMFHVRALMLRHKNLKHLYFSDPFSKSFQPFHILLLSAFESDGQEADVLTVGGVFPGTEYTILAIIQDIFNNSEESITKRLTTSNTS